MGDTADMIIEGILCEECGCYIDTDPPGHPRKCSDCKPTKTNQPKET